MHKKFQLDYATREKDFAPVNMKLLLDENLSRRMIPLLAPHYPGSTQVTLLGLEQASDQEIWKYAKLNES